MRDFSAYIITPCYPDKEGEGSACLGGVGKGEGVGDMRHYTHQSTSIPENVEKY